MEKKKKARDFTRWSVNLPDHIAEDLRTRKLKISETVKTSLLLVRMRPKYLYEVRCNVDDSIFYTIVDDISESLVIKQMMRLDYYLTGTKVNGFGEYRIRLIGSFPALSDARLYSDLLMNKALDKGLYLVNEHYTRYISISMELDRLKKVVKYKSDLSDLVNSIILFLENKGRNYTSGTGLDKSCTERIRRVLRKST